MEEEEEKEEGEMGKELDTTAVTALDCSLGSCESCESSSSAELLDEMRAVQYHTCPHCTDAKRRVAGIHATDRLRECRARL